MEGDADDKMNPFFQKSKNPFDEDVDDETFLRPSTSKFMVSENSKNPFLSDISSGVADVEGKREQVESRTLASTERSLALLAESELVGEGIANELSEQKEQLENCHKKIDDINLNLRSSQKHLRRIKSFFGGFKDFMMGVRIKPVRATSVTEKSNSSDNSIDETQASVVAHRSRSVTIKQTASSHPGLMLRSGGDNTRPRDVQYAIDQNLDHIFNHVVNLKGLAVDLGEELEHQNELIDSLNDKTEGAQISLTKQNKDIAKILKG